MQTLSYPHAGRLFPRYFWILAGLFVFAIAVPFLWAASVGRGEFVFGGFLINPLDGNSYLAKMLQGWQGSWTFTLPYTADPGQGAYLFLYYLFLGHLARWSGVNIILSFHLARLASSMLMLLALWYFFRASIADLRLQKIAFAFAIFGAGLGWLGIFFGAFTADLWVAEAYPFLAAYANPHFPLGIALIAWLLAPQRPPGAGPVNHSIARYLLSGLAAAILSIVLPFGVIIVGIVLAGLVAWQAAGMRRLSRSATLDRFLAVVLGSAPFLIYELWAISSHAQLRAWNSQNLTPSPPFWNFLLAFLPALLLAIPGALGVIRAGPAQSRVLLVWAIVGIAVLYLPFGTQRRLMLGLLVPVAGLAALGIGRLASRKPGRAWLWAALALILSLPTALLVLLAGLHGVQTRDGMLYLQASEYRALQWIAENTPTRALIMASPEMGMYIPAHTGRRVIYGHPFETIEAQKAQDQVIDFYRETRSPPAAPEADYIFMGPRERRLGEPMSLSGLMPVFQDGDVRLYLYPP